MTQYSRSQVLQMLNQLPTAAFETLLFDFNMPPAWVRRNATQTEQAIDLIRYAESQNRLSELMSFIQNNPPSSSPKATFDQAGQKVEQQINVGGDMHVHGDIVGRDKVVQNVTGHHNIFSGTGDVHLNKK